jgi:hypothetical protein
MTCNEVVVVANLVHDYNLFCFRNVETDSTRSIDIVCINIHFRYSLFYRIDVVYRIL